MDTAPQRHVAAGGWRRALVGIAVGALAGVALISALGNVRPRER